MYTIEHTDFIDSSEPQLGKLTEYEVILEFGDVELMMEQVVTCQEENECEPDFVYLIDDRTGEEVELCTSEYL